MKTNAPKIAPESAAFEQFVETKLKLKNAHVPSLKAYVDKIEKSASRKMKKALGLKLKEPLMIQALADLHLEAHYSRNGQPVTVPAPSCVLAAAKAYVDLKELEVNPFPGQPLPRRGSSGTSSTAESLSSNKSVKWAENLVEVRIID